MPKLAISSRSKNAAISSVRVFSRFGSSDSSATPPRLVRRRRALLAGIPAAVAVDVGPAIPPPPGVRVLVDVEQEVGAGIEPVLAVVELEHGLAVARQVVGDAEPRREQVEVDDVVLGRERDRRRVELAGRVLLLRQEGAVAVEPQRRCSASAWCVMRQVSLA